jgi:hypothetical protein
MSTPTPSRSAAQKSKGRAAARRSRRTPGSTGVGNYYHIQLRPSSDFVTYRTLDVGRRGHIQRVAGRRSTGSWATIKWLIAKEDAHLEGEKLVADTPAARSLIRQLGSEPVHTYGDRFSAKPKPRATRRRGDAEPTKVRRQASASRRPTTRGRK